MGWVTDALKELRAGRPAHVRPVGGSMRGRIESGQAVTVSPVDPAAVKVDDVVLVAWKSNHLLHLVKDATDEQLLIGNNLGKINGWVARSAAVGRVTDVRDEPASNLPATPAEVGDHVRRSVAQFLVQQPQGNDKYWGDLKERLLRWVRRLDPQTALLGLVWVLENEDGYQPQHLAGELLLRASLSCTLPLDQLLQRVLPAFNESANTVPVYLAAAFGREAVLGCLRAMAVSTDDPVLTGKVRTMRWWLKDVTSEEHST